jgi:hypothetical protein
MSLPFRSDEPSQEERKRLIFLSIQILMIPQLSPPF